MIQYKLVRCLGIFALICLISGCASSKYLKKDELLYLGSNLQIDDPKEASSIKDFKVSIEKIPAAGTQGGLGNIYLGLNNLFEKTNEKGFKYWVKYKLGNQPILYNDKIKQNNEAKLKYYLNGKGFFAHALVCEPIEKKQTIHLNCAIKLGPRHKIDTLVFPVDSTYIALKLDQSSQRFIIKEGSYYDRSRLDYERVRLATLAGELGFSDFGINNVYYYVDTAKTGDKVDIYMKILQPKDSSNLKRFILDSINIFPNYSINDTLNVELKRVQIAPGIVVQEYKHYLDHNLLNRLILEETDKFYNRLNERKSINRLLDLGLFRFINVDNIPISEGNQNRFIQNIYLTPHDMQSISGELELNNRSGNYLGTGLSLRYQHRNIFRHAEQLNLSFKSQIETQFGEGVSLINSLDLSANMELEFPRWIVPFIKIKETRNFIPRTIFRTNYTFQRRVKYYSLLSLTGRFGYKWRENSTTTHELYPFNLNQIRVTDKSAEFENLLLQDGRLKSSFENVLIGGLQYYVNFTNQANKNDNHYGYFRGEFETSGNLLNLVFNPKKSSTEISNNLNFAQFVKLTLDYRRYFPSRRANVATRIIMGSGLAYGSSDELPYIKQYLIGGSSSLRAFRLRGLGPGTYYVDPDKVDIFDSQFIDQTGDFKLEFNIEYRFPIFKYFKGALFADAGNIWLLNNPDRPEGNFYLNQFYKQIAIGGGFGLRLDFNFFVIRLDTAMKLRGPTASNSFSWNFKNFDLGSQVWRKDNVRYNLGIGYPF